MHRVKTVSVVLMSEPKTLSRHRRRTRYASRSIQTVTWHKKSQTYVVGLLTLRIVLDNRRNDRICMPAGCGGRRGSVSMD
jgi:hypothetical protein